MGLSLFLFSQVRVRDEVLSSAPELYYLAPLAGQGVSYPTGS